MGNRFFLLFVSPILVVTLFVFYDKTVARDDERFAGDRTLSEVRALVLSQYVEKVDDQQLLNGALKGMAGTLDPHSAYLDAESYADMRKDTEGHFGGIGVEITFEDGWVTVITPIEGTPAHEAGILAGDRILAVDGQSTEGLDTNGVSRLVRGKAGTKVTLTIYSPGDDATREVTLTRAEIQMKSVKRVGMLDSTASIGHLAITHFQDGTAKEVSLAIDALLARGMKSLVIDVRNNPGGLFDEAVAIADLFLESGVIVSTRGRIKDANREELAVAEGTLPGFPVALVVNQGSASASEILAGALQDHRRAVLVGARTYGKGSVQRVYPFDDGERGALKLTTARYYTPSGRSIHKTKDDVGGIVPDVLITLSIDEQREMARKIREETLRRRSEGGEIGAPEYVDPQLQRAIDVLKGVPVYRKLSDAGGGDE